MASLKIRMLGPFQLECNGSMVSEKSWQQKKTVLLFKLLIAHKPQLLSQDFLIDTLFTELPPDRGARGLHSRISELRRVLEPDLAKPRNSSFVLRKGQGYVISNDVGIWLDTSEFENYQTKANKLKKQEKWVKALDDYKSAISLYRGSFLEEDLYVEWTLPIRESWREQLENVLLNAAECHGHLDQHIEAIQCCQRAIDLNPYNEKSHRHKVNFLIAAREFELAVQSCKECIETLRQIDIEPSNALNQIILKLKNQNTLYSPPKVQFPIETSSFVGRSQEIEKLSLQIRNLNCRLLTIIGIGGVGKTRLAIHLVSNHVPTSKYPDGIFFIDLINVSENSQLLGKLMSSLNLSPAGHESPEGFLLDELENQDVLFLLDNAEALKQFSIIEKILQKSEGVKFLITSRSRLNLKEEWIFELEGLDYSSEVNNDAIQLFRARVEQQGIQLHIEHTKQVVEICKTLEGHPLGIELMVGWLRIFPLENLLSNLEQGIGFLHSTISNLPERHQSLRRIFEQTWDSLSKESQGIFAALSVFQNGFTAEAGNYVTGLSISELSGFLNRSLLRRQAPGRFVFHALLRHFAVEKLSLDSACEHKAHEAHREYFATFFEQRIQEISSSNPKVLDQVSTEKQNLLKQWRWTLTQGRTTMLQYSVQGWQIFFETKGLFYEAFEFFQDSTKIIESQVALQGSRIHGLVLEKQALFAYRLGKNKESKSLYERALAALHEEDSTAISRCFLVLGLIHLNTGNPQKAESLFLKGLKRSRKDNEPTVESNILLCLGNLYVRSGQYEQANENYQIAITIAQSEKITRTEFSALHGTAIIAFEQGHYHKASGIVQNCWNIIEEIQDVYAKGAVLNLKAEIASLLGDFDIAESIYRENVVQAKKTGHRATLVHGLEGLGEALLKKVQFDDAKRCYEEMRNLTEANDDQPALSRALYGLGELAIKQERFMEARPFMKQSVELAESSNEKWVHSLGLAKLGELEQKNGNSKEGIEYFKQSVDKALEAQSIRTLEVVVLGFAETLIALDEKIKAFTLLEAVLNQSEAFHSEAHKLHSSLKTILSSKDMQHAHQLKSGKSLQQLAIQFF